MKLELRLRYRLSTIENSGIDTNLVRSVRMLDTEKAVVEHIQNFGYEGVRFAVEKVWVYEPVAYNKHVIGEQWVIKE